MMSSIAAKRRRQEFRASGPLAGLLLVAAVVFGAGGSTAYATPPQSTGAADAADSAGSAVEIQLLGINDFHGRLEADHANNIAGAAVLAGAVSQLRAQNPNTVFVSAGDNVGGTPFTSFIAQDEPTIRALVAAGLDVSAVGNHEFDRGFADLSGRILPSYGSDALALGANVRFKDTGGPALPEYAIVERSGIKIGVIGVVTEDTATAVTPEFVQSLDFADQLQTASEVAERIAADVDVTVLLTHDGSPSNDCQVIAAEESTFGNLVRGLNGKVDAVFSGHTHQAYACDIAGLSVVSSGFYGAALGQITLTLNSDTFEVQQAQASLIPLVQDGAAAFTPDPVIAGIVADAVAEAEAQGSQPVGRISASILRGGTPSGSDRGVESALGNLIADIMAEKVPEADLAIVNPGSLRADLVFAGDGTLAYRDVASVQPFGNTLIVMTLTGAQLREILEAQWYLDGGLALKRHLAVSQGFSYTFYQDPVHGARIDTLTLHGVPLADSDTVRIVTNAFLAGGGDGFSTFAEGQNRVDTGYNDLQVTVEFFQANPVVDPPPLGRAIPQNQPAPAPGPSPKPDPEPTPDPGPAPTPDPAPATDPVPQPAEHTIANTGATTSMTLGLAGASAALLLLGLAFYGRALRGTPGQS